MHKSILHTHTIMNTFLFELQTNPHPDMDAALHAFLSSHQFPWLALGPTLVAFIQECVSAVPAHQRHAGKIHSSVVLEHEDAILIDPSAVVEPGAFIAGPCVVGPHVTIRHGAYVRGGVYLSYGSLVGHTTECKGSLLLPHAKAAHFNYVGDSILGVGCNLGAGTKLANLKMNHKTVRVHAGDQKIDTGLKKLGAVLGNRAQTGCNAVTNPGTILLPDQMILANQTAW